MEWIFKKGLLDSFACNRIFIGDSDGGFVGYNNGALILGKIRALFGEPSLGADFDDFYTYYIIAEASGKEPVGLVVHEHGNAPSVDYPDGAEDAASALAEMINAAEPTDYEYRIKCDEDFSMVTYFVKNGKEGSKRRTLTIMEIFDGDPSQEDIKQFTELGYKLE